MSTSRALANQKLYHAKILINAWRVDLAQEEVASVVLEQAFGRAVCRYLAEAYGWFLLEITQPETMPTLPPACCAQLPPPGEGRQTPPEILEFQQLEGAGWLKQILQPADGATKPQSSKGAASHNLATVVSTSFGPDQAEASHSRLSQLFDRMTDSLDEY